jgi:hypothetical protein
MATQNLHSTTQQYLDIFDITNDLVMMKNGTTSLILSVDAMNFGLLAEEEQDSIIYAYAGLLNSLNYSIQILIRSQTKDVTSYLQKLKEQEEKADSKQNQTRIRRYREFVSNLIHERNVLDKKFYVVIPAGPIELGLMPIKSVVPGQQQFDISTVERSVVLEKAKNILEPKRDHLAAQFSRIGLYAYQLNTQEIIQLFYLSYNPEASEGQQIAESHSYSTPLVKASFEGTPMFSQSANNNQVVTPASSAPGAPAQSAPALEQTMPQNMVGVGQTNQEVGQDLPTMAPVSPATPPVATEAVVINQPDPEVSVVATPTSPLPSQTPPVSSDELAKAQEEINKTLGQISPTDAPGAFVPEVTPEVDRTQQVATPVLNQESGQEQPTS